MRECSNCFADLPDDTDLLCAKCSYWFSLTSEQQREEIALMDAHVAQSEGI